MKEIMLLDCTLRDGGRIIDCAFREEQIAGILKRLMQAKVEIIELGFLRNGDYKGNSTFFTQMEQVEPFLPQNSKQEFTVFVDYGLYDIEKLTPCNPDYRIGIRYGFTRKQFQEKPDILKAEMLQIKEKGYRLYFQGVNTIGYSDKELLDLITMINEVVPYSFGIVDTYGAMFPEDLSRIFSLVDFNLNSTIAIDFHSHNNMQMAFALAQEMIKLCKGRRELLIDATLDGMGKCAGNLNTELIAHYLNQKQMKNYDFDYLLDAIDEYIYSFKQIDPWGYSIPAFMAGIYKAHPNNVIYLTDKFRLATKDIRKILSMIEEDKRQRYDYDNIQEIYKSYFASPVEDDNVISTLQQSFSGKTILVIAPGRSVLTYNERIRKYITEEKPVVISVNFIFDGSSCVFYGNDRRYQMLDNIDPERLTILTSNVTKRTGNELVCDYMKCIAHCGNYFDNSTLMLLNLLARVRAKKIRIAGMDGFTDTSPNYFFDNSDIEVKCADQFEVINREMESHLRRYAETNQDIDLSLITPSRFQNVLKLIEM